MRSRPKNMSPNQVPSRPENLQSQPKIFDRIELSNFKYLTQNIEPPEIVPVRKITSYTVSFTEKDLSRVNQEPCCSKTLLNETSFPSESPTSENAEETITPQEVVDQPRLRQFQLTLKPQITIIDSRPMIKKNLMKSQANNSTNGNHTPPLITIDEDCDTTDEEEIIEIDCDTGSRYTLRV